MKSRLFLSAVGLSLLSLSVCTAQEAAPTPPVESAAAAKSVKVVMETSKGSIEIELDAEKAPISAANFVSYVKKGFYDGTIFHRVIPGFMAQGGGFTDAMEKKETDAAIKNEGQNGLKNLRGTIAMARTSELDSATSQFFINVVDNAGLDYPSNGGYAVFGKVTKGMEVVDAIVNAPTTVKAGMGDVPVEAITIKSAKLAE
jgi:cyclophilin family peptidyl-prolyl cis-trans isomerase